MATGRGDAARAATAGAVAATSAVETAAQRMDARRNGMLTPGAKRRERARHCAFVQNTPALRATVNTWRTKSVDLPIDGAPNRLHKYARSGASSCSNAQRRSTAAKGQAP